MPDRELGEVADWVLRTGLIQDLEIGVGGYSPSPHCRPGELLGRPAAAASWRKPIDDAGLGISALNVSGNPLHPNPEIAARHDSELRQAIRLAAQLGVERIVAMSGCPGAGPTDRTAPHFSGGGWLPDLERIAEWQWSERVRPYWKEISSFAASEHPDLAVCLELHPRTYVYNVATFRRISQLGENIAVILDPNHFFRQSIHPIAVIGAVGRRVGYVHAKDTRFNRDSVAVNGLLDNRWPDPPGDMPWTFATVGRGHDAGWWNSFVEALRAVGYDGPIGIEHEDPFVGPETGVSESVSLLAEY